jgi:hypothetical protein
LEDLEYSYLQRRGEYPATLTEAYNLLVHWRNIMQSSLQIQIASSDGVAFTNVGDDDDSTSEQGTTLATDGKPKKDLSHITCVNCNEQGHYASDCTKPKRETASQYLMAGVDAGEFDKDEGVSFSFCMITGPPRKASLDYKKALLTKPSLKSSLKNALAEPPVQPPVHRSAPVNRRSVDHSHIMKQSKGGCIDPNWILLDNQSMVDVFYNRRLLKDIKQVDTWIDIYCNAGVTSTNLQGELPGYGTVWYHNRTVLPTFSLSLEDGSETSRDIRQCRRE